VKRPSAPESFFTADVPAANHRRPDKQGTLRAFERLPPSRRAIALGSGCKMFCAANIRLTYTLDGRLSARQVEGVEFFDRRHGHGAAALRDVGTFIFVNFDLS